MAAAVGVRTLTIGTYTDSYPPAERCIAAAQALEAMGCFDHLWSGDQLQFQHPHAPERCLRPRRRCCAHFSATS